MMLSGLCTVPYKLTHGLSSWKPPETHTMLPEHLATGTLYSMALTTRRPLATRPGST